MLNTVEHWKSTVETASGGETYPASHGDVTIPSLPAEAVQLNTTGQSGQATLEAASEFFETCRGYFQRSSVWGDESKTLLDFGCGWGRITRFFLFDFKPANLFGIDVEKAMIDECKNTFHGQGNFLTCPAFPPTTLAPESIAFVVGFSVFSHLSENACRQWLEHFHTLLKPGGIIIVSTRGKAFLQYCRALASTNPKDSYSQALSAMFEDFDDAERRYDAGEFLFRTSSGLSGGGSMNESFYGETFIPLQYARTHYSDLFDAVEFSPDDCVHRSVPYLIFKKLTTEERQAELNRLREGNADRGADVPTKAGDLADAAIVNRMLEAKLRSAELRHRFAREQLGGMSSALLEVITENIKALRSWTASVSWKVAAFLPRVVSRALGRKVGEWSPSREADALEDEIRRLTAAHGEACDGHIPVEKLTALRRRSSNVLNSLEASLSLQLTGPLRSIDRLRNRAFGAFYKNKQAGAAHSLRAGKPTVHLPVGSGRESSPAPGESRENQEASFAIYYSTEGNYFFREISILLAMGFRKLGIAYELRTEADGWSDSAKFHLVVAPHEYFFLGRGPEDLDTISRDSLLLLNTEQHQTPWFERALSTFSHARHIFDIHDGGIETIKRLGLSASHLPLGYLEDFALYNSIAPLPHVQETESLSSEVCDWLDLDLPLSLRPIDVSFVGEANLRRALFFSKAAGCLQKFECHLRLIPQTGPLMAGAGDRDLRTRLTAGISRRSKIVLNVHRDNAPYFEWHRIVLMGIWQKALVITETVTDAPPFVPGVDFVHAPLDKIPELIDYYLRDPGGIREAEQIRSAGFRKLKDKCQLTAALARAINPILHDAVQS